MTERNDSTRRPHAGGVFDLEAYGSQTFGAESPEEAAEFADVAAQLGLAADPVEPPASLKAGLMAKLASTPQLPPLEADVSVAAPYTSAPHTAAPAAYDATPANAASPGTAEARVQRRWFTRPVTILTAAAAAVVLFVGGAVVGTSLTGNSGTTFQTQQASALAAINAAPDAQRASSAVSGGGTATLVWSGTLGKSAIVVDGISKLPQTKTYELWYIAHGKATPAGTMEPTGSGATWRVLEGTMSAGDAVGVTIEPSGGSKQPTTVPVVAIQS